MKALVYKGKRSLEFCDEPDPVPKPCDTLVKVESVGICGSDMHAYLGHDERRPPPLILGHEVCGRAIGGHFDGQRVVINPLVSCGDCNNCNNGRPNICSKRQIISMPPRQGAFAEYLTMPSTNVIPVPEGLEASKAALAEPMATAYHAVTLGERLLWRQLGSMRVLVMGGGAVGLSAALVLRSKIPDPVIIAETNPKRRETAQRAGFDVFNPTDELCNENTFGLVIDAVGGRKTRSYASNAVAPGGTIVHIGLLDSNSGIDIRKFTLQEITFVGAYTYTMTDFKETLDAMANSVFGDLDWIEERPLAEGAAAFQELEEGRLGAAKVLLIP